MTTEWHDTSHNNIVISQRHDSSLQGDLNFSSTNNQL